MEKYLTILQIIFAGAIAWVSDRLGILFPLLCVLCALMTADYFTGMAASKAEALDHPGDKKYGWDSKKGARGILKKVGYMAVIAAAISLDYMTLTMASQMGLDVQKSVFFGILVTAWYILNEALSIIENAGRMGSDVPDWLARCIAALKDKIDDKGNED